MKRRDFTAIILSSGLMSCSIDPQPGESVATERRATTVSSESTQTGSRRSRSRSSGPTDLKSLSTILQRAMCPLSEAQINFLTTLKEGPEFSERMSEVLDSKQLEALKNAGGRRRR